MDTGIAVVIAAVLIFYLRLIILQRERAKRIALTHSSKKRKGQVSAPVDYSIVTRSPRNRIIAGVGLLGVVAGVVLAQSWLPWTAAQPYWWIPTAAGIVLFSWGFAL